MTRMQAIVVALAVLLAGGIVHGLSSERWRSSEVLEQAAARIDNVPKAFGDWQSRDEAEDEQAFDKAGARKHWTRIYSNKRTRESVRVILMCGRAGKMAVHTPQMCYVGAGYEMPEDAIHYVVRPAGPAEAGTFWTALFTKPAALTTDLRLFWAWNVHGTWQAADNPRWEFRGQPFLYKLYVANALQGRKEGEPGDNPGAAFLRSFLPELQRALFPQRPILTYNCYEQHDTACAASRWGVAAPEC